MTTDTDAAAAASAAALPDASLDPVMVEIVRGALRSIQGEMEALIERTAMSAFIREKKDFHAALFDPQGRVIATKSRPSSADLIAPILALYPADTMSAGDMYWYNDCYAASGAVSHSPDMVMIAPVFSGDQLVAFVQTWAHFTDIGGMRPGSITPDCTEIFQEGMIVPPVRLAHQGRFNEDLLRVFTRNSRFPKALAGDMRATMASLRLGERRIEELAQRFGSAQLVAVFSQLIERTRAVLRARFRALVPDGVYRFTDIVDSDGHGSGPVKIRWKLEVTPDRVVMDATESDDQVRGPINYLMSRTEPAMAFGSYLLADSREYSLNAGALTLFDEVRLREGSILRPRFPAALGQRGVTRMRNTAAYLGLLGMATRGHAPASHSAYVLWNVRGRDAEGEPFVLSDGVAVGWGARPHADGHDAVYLISQENYPVEFIENSYPLRVRSYGINPDTGGPGRWRGGCGVVREFEILTDEATVSVRLDTIKNPPWGVAGGRCAGVGRCVVNPGRADERELPPLSDGNVVRRGDVVRLQTGGGGGWGHPFDREPERVLEDVLNGFVSRVSATADYGVALTPAGDRIDVADTERLRSERPATKFFHRHEYMEELQ
jgi:N-methylhydantoinase B